MKQVAKFLSLAMILIGMVACGSGETVSTDIDSDGKSLDTVANEDGGHDIFSMPDFDASWVSSGVIRVRGKLQTNVPGGSTFYIVNGGSSQVYSVNSNKAFQFYVNMGANGTIAVHAHTDTVNVTIAGSGISWE